MADREPGWYWVKLCGGEWLPCDYCYEQRRGRMMVADGSSFYELSEVDEWGPRISTPVEPVAPRDESAPPPGWCVDEFNDGWQAFLCDHGVVVCPQYKDRATAVRWAWNMYQAGYGYAPPRAASPEGPGGDE